VGVAVLWVNGVVWGESAVRTTSFSLALLASTGARKVHVLLDPSIFLPSITFDWGGIKKQQHMLLMKPATRRTRLCCQAKTHFFFLVITLLQISLSIFSLSSFRPFSILDSVFLDFA